MPEHTCTRVHTHTERTYFHSVSGIFPFHISDVETLAVSAACDVRRALWAVADASVPIAGAPRTWKEGLMKSSLI